MAFVHLRLADRAGVMELLGELTSTVPEDEVYGLMAASGVILSQANVKGKGKDKAWAQWWEEARRTGHIRWALLATDIPAAAADPPTMPRNCIMPGFSVRHIASRNSNLDYVQLYGQVRGGCRRHGEYGRSSRRRL
jgi:hypothetical protein